MRSSNTSGVQGVYYLVRDERWVAEMRVGGERREQRFSTKQEAEVVRLDWEVAIEQGVGSL
jgi:hypothetical protein